MKRGIMEVDTMDVILAENNAIAQQLTTLNKKLEKLEVAAMSTQPSPFPQLITLPPPPQPKPPQANFEAALEKLTMTNMEFVQTTTTFIEEARTNFRNQESAIRNIETQMGQIARQFSTPMLNAFPSETMVNPTVECYAINIRSGEALQDRKQKGLNKKDVKGTPTKPTKEEMVMNAIQYPEEDEEDWYMRIDVIEELNREVQQEDAMQKFQAKQGRYDVLDDTNQDFVMQEINAIVQKNIAEMQQEHLELQQPSVEEIQPNNVEVQQHIHDLLQ
ncbi:hypothetical protein PIB30_071525 [Stylosanthes scabra]|uniref:Uncharacterized protein n=1 Tax=Stylosanthes scabra TaxID=79078 RepID=A0ABU6QND7_9FABA|nr:hypothetical protein [Stylosanthes scabra]